VKEGGDLKQGRGVCLLGKLLVSGTLLLVVYTS
jgi:hypothetical protein